MNFPQKILWSDECTFTNNGMFNRHNEHTWATKIHDFEEIIKYVSVLISDVIF